MPGQEGGRMTGSIKRTKGIIVQMMLAVSILTAAKGVNTFEGHKETWYNLKMTKVIQRTDKAFGMTDLYHIREDGVKMYGPWVIVAADPRVHGRYTLVETSLGTGICLDVHTVEDDPELIDIATNW